MPILALVASVALQAAALFAAVALYAVELITGGAQSPAMAAFIMATAAVIGAALAYCARAIHRGKRRARGPIVTWQIFLITVGIPLTQGGTPWIGALILAVAVATLVLLFTPKVMAHTGAVREKPRDL